MVTFEQQQIIDFASALGDRLSRKEKNIVNRIYALVSKTGVISKKNWAGLEQVAHRVTNRETPKKRTQKKKQQRWAQASKQERDFYKSYQPRTFNRSRTPSQLLGDRLCLTGISKYNGAQLHNIPTQYLKTILDTKINNNDDKAYIMAHLELRKSGTNLSVSINDSLV
jgi:hypothetical protein